MDQGTKIHNVYKSYFHYFSTNQTLNCLEFIDWCANNYSSSQRVIMDTTSSKFLCLVSPLVIRNTLSVPAEFNQKSNEYNEESMVQYFRDSTVKKKLYFFKICFNHDVQLQNQPFPIDSKIFNEETQCAITLMSLFLGLDTNKYIIGPLMSILFTLNTYQAESRLRFLVEDTEKLWRIYY